MNIKQCNITVVFNNANVCSGHCAFCTAANELNYGQPNASSINDIKHINEALNNMIKWDYDALEQAIVNYPGFEDSNRIGFSVWGGDPLTSFDQYVELYEFCTDICKRHNKTASFGGSTNGLAFMVPEWRDWFVNHSNNIRMQLSHDGVGNWMRTNVDTIKLAEPLMETGMINWISCVMNFYNPSPFQNIEFFEEHIPNQIYKNIQARLYTVRDAYYDAAALNTDGWFMNKQYDQLKNTKIGDMVIRNDQELSNKYGIFNMAHAADIYFDEVEQIYKDIDNSRYDPYRNVLIQRLAYNRRKAVNGDILHMNRPWCAQYHTGLRDNSNCIDTLGKYTPCHLYDSDTAIPNPKLEKPARCNDCPYKNNWECNVCGSFYLNPSYCQWSYRFNQQMQRLIKQSRWLNDWIRAYNNNRGNLNHIDRRLVHATSQSR